MTRSAVQPHLRRRLVTRYLMDVAIARFAPAGLSRPQRTSTGRGPMAVLVTPRMRKRAAGDTPTLN
ncbi:MAG: hypothetical protein ACP5PW_07835 [Candidatus Dormibacteria bacterium]